MYNTFLNHSNDTHKHIIQAIILKLTDMESDLGLMLQELCISTATGTWLNEWGSWFGVRRKNRESDEDYSARIITSIKAPKSTLSALKDNAVNFLNSHYVDANYSESDIKVIEPYKFINAMSHRGTLSGMHRFPDGNYWRRNIVEISIPEEVTQEFIEMIDSIKAAGVQVLYSVEPLSGGILTGFSENENFFTDSNIIIERQSTRMSEGVLLSISSGGTLSGRRKLWGIEHSVIFDSDIVNMFRVWDKSYLFQNGVWLPVAVPTEVKTPSQLSVIHGTLSGYKLPYVEIKTLPQQLTEQEKKHLQAPIQREMFTVKSHILSTQARLSEDTALSGSYGETYKYKGHASKVDTMIDAVFRGAVTDLERLLHTEISIPVNRWGGTLSGKRTLWGSEVLLSGSPKRVDMRRVFSESEVFKYSKQLATPFRRYGVRQDADTAILSVQDGVLSGPHDAEISLIYNAGELIEEEQTFLQPDIATEIGFLKPQVISVHSRLSGANVMSGAYKDTHDRPLFEAKAELFAEDLSNAKALVNDLTFDMYIMRGLNDRRKNILSGRSSIATVDNIGLDIKHKDSSINWGSHVLTVAEVLQQFANKSIADLYDFEPITSIQGFVHSEFDLIVQASSVCKIEAKNPISAIELGYGIEIESGDDQFYCDSSVSLAYENMQDEYRITADKQLSQELLINSGDDTPAYISTDISLDYELDSSEQVLLGENTINRESIVNNLPWITSHIITVEDLLNEFDCLSVEEATIQIANYMPIHRHEISRFSDVLHDASYIQLNNDVAVSHCIDIQAQRGGDISREINLVSSAYFSDNAFNWGSPVLTVSEVCYQFAGKSLDELYNFKSPTSMQGAMDSDVHLKIQPSSVCLSITGKILSDSALEHETKTKESDTQFYFDTGVSIAKNTSQQDSYSVVTDRKIEYELLHNNIQPLPLHELTEISFAYAVDSSKQTLLIENTVGNESVMNNQPWISSHIILVKDLLHEFEYTSIDEIDGKIMNHLPIHRNDISSANEILHDSSHSEVSNDLEISHCVDVQMDAGTVKEINREMAFELSTSFRNTAFN